MVGLVLMMIYRGRKQKITKKTNPRKPRAFVDGISIVPRRKPRSSQDFLSATFFFWKSIEQELHFPGEKRVMPIPDEQRSLLGGSSQDL